MSDKATGSVIEYARRVSHGSLAASKGLRNRISPTCTLSQNGYGASLAMQMSGLLRLGSHRIAADWQHWTRRTSIIDFSSPPHPPPHHLLLRRNTALLQEAGGLLGQAAGFRYRLARHVLPNCRFSGFLAGDIASSCF